MPDLRNEKLKREHTKALSDSWLDLDVIKDLTVRYLTGDITELKFQIQFHELRTEFQSDLNDLIEHEEKVNEN